MNFATHVTNLKGVFTMLQGLNFVLLHVTDIEKATAFYTEKLGLVIEDQQPGFVQFKQPMGQGATFALSSEGDGTPIQNVELWWFVDDADATYADFAAKGVPMAQSLKDEPFGRTFAIQDPSGNTLYMMKLADRLQ
jgi:predicted enzyme related to lactoylglutathione lyase